MHLTRPAALLLLPALAACRGAGADDTDVIDVIPVVDGVQVTNDPDPPLAAAPDALTASVKRSGEPYPLVQTHGSYLHLFIIGPDLAFQHLHPEDFGPVDDEIAAATFDLPVVFPTSGVQRLVFEYADGTTWGGATVDVAVGGDPAPTDPDLVVTSESDAGRVHLALQFDSAPIAGAVSGVTLVVTDDAGDVTDLVPLGGSDGQLIFTNADRSVIGHAHPYIQGLENAPPGTHEPHLYPGPDVPFHPIFRSSGTYVVWTEVARADAPTVPIRGRFVVTAASPARSEAQPSGVTGMAP
jgi:hypothetical protein